MTARPSATRSTSATSAGPSSTRPSGRQLIADTAALNALRPYTTADFDLYMRALLHAIRVMGVDHVGLGADWDGGGGVIGMEDITALPRISARLRREGFSEADIAKVMGGNLLRVMRQVQAARRRAGLPPGAGLGCRGGIGVSADGPRPNQPDLRQAGAAAGRGGRQDWARDGVRAGRELAAIAEDRRLDGARRGHCRCSSAGAPISCMLYNDAYAEILGDRGPAMGRPAREVWADIWDRIRAQCRARAGRRDPVLRSRAAHAEARRARGAGLADLRLQPDPRRGRQGRPACSARSSRSAATPAPRSGCARARSASG